MFRTILAFTFAAAASADVQITGANGEYFNVLGQSGKILMGLNSETSVEIRMSAVVERDSDGNAVGKSGSVKHTFNNFASQDFTFGEPEYSDWDGVEYAKVPFQSQLFADTNLTVDIYLFTGEGEITDGSNTFTVGPGTFKYSYYLENWPFCTLSANGGNVGDNTLCTKGGSEEEGATLDFTITVTSQGLGDASFSDEEASTNVNWDDGSVLINPEEYMIDGTPFTMAAGYPQSTTVNETTTLVFRFDRFDSGTLYYDPVMGFAGNSTNSTGNVTDVNVTSPGGHHHHHKKSPKAKKSPKSSPKDKKSPRGPRPRVNGKSKPSDKVDNSTLSAGSNELFATISEPVTAISVGVLGFLAAFAVGLVSYRSYKKAQWAHKSLPVTSGHEVSETRLVI